MSSGLAQIASPRRCLGSRAFTLVELLVVISVVVLLVGVLLVALSGARRTSRHAACLANLRAIATGFSVYASENRGHLPDPWAAQMPWEAMLSGYVASRDLFQCPADQELFKAIGSSYDWRDLPDEQASLAGRSITSVPPSTLLAFDALPGWHQEGFMNVACVDGSAQAMPEKECLENMMSPVHP